MSDRIRFVWTPDPDVEGVQYARLVCPKRGCNPDVTVHTHPAAARQIASHIAHHANVDHHQEKP